MSIEITSVSNAMEIFKADVNEEIEVKTSYDLQDSFASKLNDIFKFKDNEIKTAGSANDPWFRAKDILRILGYKIELGNQTKLYKKLDVNDYKPLSELVSAQDTNSLVDYHEGKEVYVNESGLYELIFNCKLQTAKIFKKFVMNELLPNIRKQVQKRYQDMLKGKQDQLDVV